MICLFYIVFDPPVLAYPDLYLRTTVKNTHSNVYFLHFLLLVVINYVLEVMSIMSRGYIPMSERPVFVQKVKCFELTF